MVDALASGASGFTAVKVRVLSWAPLLPKPLILNALIRRFDRRSDAPPTSGRNTSPPAESSSLRRRHVPPNRNACVKAAKALGWRRPRQHRQGARGCNACGGGYPALLLGLPQRLFRSRHAVRSFSPSTILLFSRASMRCDRLATSVCCVASLPAASVEL